MVYSHLKDLWDHYITSYLEANSIGTIIQADVVFPPYTQLEGNYSRTKEQNISGKGHLEN